MTKNNTDNSDDEWCEEEERPSGVTDTLLQQPDITENSEKVLSFAPGEGNILLGIFMDRDSVVKPDLIAKIGKYQFIIAQCVGGN